MTQRHPIRIYGPTLYKPPLTATTATNDEEQVLSTDAGGFSTLVAGAKMRFDLYLNMSYSQLVAQVSGRIGAVGWGRPSQLVAQVSGGGSRVGSILPSSSPPRSMAGEVGCSRISDVRLLRSVHACCCSDAQASVDSFIADLRDAMALAFQV